MRCVFDARFRSALDRVTAPAGAVLHRAGIRADHLTVCGVLAATAAGFVISRGMFLIGLALLVMTALPDLLDGPVARASDRVSPRGKFLDSVADRVSDVLLLTGVAWYFSRQERPDVTLLCLGVLGASMLVSYERARAEGLGLSCRGGLMERAERIVALGIGLAFPSILVPLLWVMLALTCITVGQRFLMVWRAVPPGLEGPQEAAMAGAEPRWRAWKLEARRLGHDRSPHERDRVAWKWPARLDSETFARRQRRSQTRDAVKRRNAVEKLRNRAGRSSALRGERWSARSAGD